MDMTTATALAGFAFASSVTPGPNNLMLMASGANFGLRRSLPHMLGVSLGHGFLILCVGLGLAALFERQPQLRLAITVGSVGYMLWLAWKIATAAPAGTGNAPARPLTFAQAAAFQWVNPKGWIMAITAISVYAGSASGAVIAVVAIFVLVNLPSVSLWTIMGTQIARLLRNPRHLRVFNGMMAALLVATLAVMI
ncbi:MAG: hypothetical protein CSA65_05205 [Proteobacteria bacterium]|nr:MAG: hypothetical protein CSA65_05205 [Pseudomonadota bacterium]